MHKYIILAVVSLFAVPHMAYAANHIHHDENIALIRQKIEPEIIAANQGEQTTCPQNMGQNIGQNFGMSLQILGTGGPIAEGSRAGSSNLIWIDGKARFLFDIGPGMFIRFGEAKANFTDLEAIFFTHAHGDHISGLPGLLNSGSFSGRTQSLQFIGPKGDEFFAGPTQILTAIYGANGILPYLGGYGDGSDNKAKISPVEIDTANKALHKIYAKDGIEIQAISVHHGPVPSLAYIVKYKGRSIIFAGDHSFLSEDFVTQLSGSNPDILVMHNVISMADGQPRGLHRDGNSIGEAAAAIKPKMLLLTHHMKRALDDKDAVLAAIKSHFTGEIIMANDLDCF
ncbi:MBL fold metallo-hydrolase [Sphingorhabdus lutea]|nr:MBL fold metallo-hydrolase [Sphingorhabdus lutea]